MGKVGYLWLFAAALAASSLGTAALRNWGPRVGLVDLPSGRKGHRFPAPVVGGLGIFCAVLVSGAVAVAFRVASTFWARPTPALLAAGALLFLVGLCDDLHDLRARYKLSLQVLACSIAIAGGLVLREIPLSSGEALALGWMSYPLTLFWLLGMINAINLIDGMDGLAGGIVGLAAAALLALAIREGFVFLGIPMVLLLGSVLGFLPLNLSRRAVFLGDSGSMLLGFLLAADTVLAVNRGGTSSPLIICVAFTSIPILDVAITIRRRLHMGTGLFQADAWHIHHRLLWLGLGPRRALLALLGLTVALGCLGIAVATEFQMLPLGAGFLFGSVALAGIYRQWRARRLSFPEVSGSALDLASLLVLARKPAVRDLPETRPHASPPTAPGAAAPSSSRP